jgi:hypothetical protein
LIRESGGADPEEIVRRKCREIVKSAKASGWSGPPFDPFILASLRGIKVKKVQHNIGAEARVFGKGAQVFIEYRPNMTLMERLRFSICHEIVHTVFPDCYETVRHLHFEGEQQTEAEREFERLCDAGAGELLMPQEEFVDDLQKTTLTLTDVCALKKRYHASAEATVNRCLGITELPRAAIFFHDPQSLLVVKYFWKSTSFRLFIPPGMAPPKESVIHSFSDSKGMEPTPTNTQLETWWANGRPMFFKVQAIMLPPVPQKPDYPKVLALVAPSNRTISPLTR